MDNHWPPESMILFYNRIPMRFLNYTTTNNPSHLPLPSVRWWCWSTELMMFNDVHNLISPIPSGKLSHNYGKSPCFMGKIHYFYGHGFNSYVSLPKGISFIFADLSYFLVKRCNTLSIISLKNIGTHNGLLKLCWSYVKLLYQRVIIPLNILNYDIHIIPPYYQWCYNQIHYFYGHFQ